MKSIIVLPLFIFYGFLSFAQISFNKIIDTGFPQARLYHTTIDNDTLVGYGLGFSDTIDWKQGLVLVKIDSSGGLIQSKILLDSLGDKMGINKDWGGIINTVDGGYALTASPIERNSSMLIKLNQDLEVEFIKEYLDTINQSNFDYSIVEVSNGYILYGSYQKPDSRVIGFVRYVDKQGEFIWQKDCDFGGIYNWINDLKIGKDSVLILVTLTVFNLNPLETESSIQYLDLSGNTIKSRKWESSSKIGYMYSVMPKNDGGLILYSSYIHEWIGSTQILHTTFTRLDSDLEIVWLYRYGEPKSVNSQSTLWSFAQTKDLNYIGAGEHTFKIGNEPSRRGGWLFHFTPTGDSLWFEIIEPPVTPELGHGGFFGGVGVLSDGSVVAGGGANEDGQTSVWVVKVNCSDSLFCGEPIVGVEEIVEALEKEVLIYPNPANNFVKVKVPKATFIQQVNIYNYQGQLVLTKQYNKENPELTINTQSLPIGIYILQFADTTSKLHTFKILISR
jgi:hypothetical protein